MKPANEIRRENLRYLARRNGSVARLAEKLDRSPAQVSQWINASKDSKTGKPRSISNNSARFIEKALGLPDYWLDQDHASKPQRFIGMQPDARETSLKAVEVGDVRRKRTEQDGVGENLDQIRALLMTAPESVREDAAKLIFRYINSEDEGTSARMLRAIKALLDDSNGNSSP